MWSQCSACIWERSFPDATRPTDYRIVEANEAHERAAHTAERVAFHVYTHLLKLSRG